MTDRKGRRMAENAPLIGTCTCGAVQYQLTRAPMFVNCCHCHSCQQQSGSAFAINAIIETKYFELLAGAVEMIETPTDSGNGQKIHRCTDCKVAIWSHYAGGNEKISFVRVGTLQNPERCPPDAHIFTRSKQPWVALPPDAQTADVYYDAKNTWSAESLERRRLAMNDG